MLQEGVDAKMLQGLYQSEPLEIYYKCFGLNKTFLTNKVTTTVDKIPHTWQDLFLQEPDILSQYKKISKWNQDAPSHSAHYYIKLLDLETHIKGSDKIELVYQNVCLPQSQSQQLQQESKQ